MTIDIDPPDDGTIRRIFLDRPDVAAKTFELALVLGGTVSAGAYTAGAIDFLIEALDCFAEAKSRGEVPEHKVILKLIAGTSGGGVNAAIAARVLGFDVPHVNQNAPVDGTPTGNPFYDVWVNELALDRFLNTSDIDGSLPSVLNGEPIDAAARHIVHFAGPLRWRDWVASPLRIILTVTNLRGIPYRIDLGKGLSQNYVDHADYMRFAALYPGQALADPRPDEALLPLGTGTASEHAAWEGFSLAAKATAAFPLGFPARALTRPTIHYKYRITPFPNTGGQPDSWIYRTPDWDSMGLANGGTIPDNWDFLAADGGVTDNQPIELARTTLVGLLNRASRDPDRATRAVWLIDPFAGKAALGPSGETTFTNELGAIISTLTQQTRYGTADLALAADPNICSRFMLTPTRPAAVPPDLTGDKAIASAGLHAFIGFACRDFMHFDYHLGRQNCQKFLLEEFLLSDENLLFGTPLDPRYKTFQRPASPGKLPIIPLVGKAAEALQLPPWPKGKLDPERYRDAIEARFRAIFQFELGGSIGKSALAWIGAHVTQKQAAEYLINGMKDYLRDADLD
jgi:hypothetical protein